jgi:broad specificity phosphatase PhoE
MKWRWPTLVIIIGVIVIVIGGVIFCWPRQMTTVILIRHAEPGDTPPGNPTLNAAGQARAQTLRHVAGSAGVAAIFTSELTRTQETVQPLATQLGLAIIPMPTTDVAALVNEIRTNHRGQVVLVAGHSNTVPQMIQQLGGGTVTIGDLEFDNLFILTIHGGRVRLLRLKYGAPS